MTSRILVVDDLDRARDWLRAAAALAFPDATIVVAPDLASAPIDPLPTLALIDLKLPDGSGVSLIRQLKSRDPAITCVVATVFDDDAHLFPAIEAGADGYVLKDQTPEALADMLAKIAEGHPPLSPSIARRLLAHFKAPRPRDETELTARETDVLRLVAKGYTLKETADAFGLSRHTVAGHLKEIYRKLSVNSRAQATMEAAKRGLVR